MPLKFGGTGVAGGGIIYVLSRALRGPGLPDPAVADPNATYGRVDGYNVVSLWRYAARPAGTVTTFADASGFYKGNHNANPTNPTNVLDYYFNDNFEHFRVSSAGLGWINPPNPIATYLPAAHVWIDGDGSNGGQGSYDSDAAAIEYLDTTAVLAAENYVFYGRDEDELRVIAGADFVSSAPRWEGVSAGTGPVPGPPGRDGSGAAVSLARTGASPQVLVGDIDWDTVEAGGFYTVTPGGVQTNAPAGVDLGALHVFSSQSYLVHIGWSFEPSARTFTRTRPGGSGAAFGGWERIHIPIGAIVSLLEARVGDERLLITALRGTIPVDMLPAEVVLESEFTAARVRGILGLTVDEVDNLFTGATIAGQIITYTQNDGTVETITIPVAAGGMADGVVQSAALNGTTLVLTLTTGGTVEVNLSGLQTAAGVSEMRVQELINATNLSALQGQLTDGQIPDDIMRDVELTAARVRAVLNLTADEVNNLFTGASIAGQVITYTQNDGTVETITVPAAMTDGVVASAALVNGTMLVLTLSTGETVEVDLEILQVGGAAAQRVVVKPPTAVLPTTSIQSLELDSSLGDAPQHALVEVYTWHSTSPSAGAILRVHIQDLRTGTPLVVGASVQVPSGDELPGVYAIRGFRSQNITSFSSNAAMTLSIGYIDDTHIGFATTNAGGTAALSPFDRMRVVVTPLAGARGERGLPGSNTIRVQDENDAAVGGIETLRVVGAGASIEVVGTVGILTVHDDGGTTPPVVAHTNFLGIGDDTVWIEAEFTVSGQLAVLTVPDYDGAMHVCFARPASMGDFTYVYIYDAVRNTDNQITSWMQQVATLDLGGEAHNLLYSIGPLTGAGGLRIEAG